MQTRKRTQEFRSEYHSYVATSELRTMKALTIAHKSSYSRVKVSEFCPKLL